MVVNFHFIAEVWFHSSRIRACEVVADGDRKASTTFPDRGHGKRNMADPPTAANVRGYQFCCFSRGLSPSRDSSDVGFADGVRFISFSTWTVKGAFEARCA